MSTPRLNRRRRHKPQSNEIIVIDSDDEIDAKPAAKPIASSKRSASAKKMPANNTTCISLLDSSDEENDDVQESRHHHHPHHHSSPGRRNKRKLNKAELNDRELAEQLQRQEHLAAKKASSINEQNAMSSSNDGKAVLAVQEIISLVNKAKEKFINNNSQLKRFTVEAVTIDDMVYFAKNMLDLQQEFVAKGINGYIDTGYHYTNSRNLDKIRTHGLMTAAERSSNNVSALGNGAAFGDGIYTANNGTNFRSFGDCGLIVGRLQGKAVRVGLGGMFGSRQGIDANTIIGDKTAMGGLSGRMGGVMSNAMSSHDGWPEDDQFHEIVLRSSKQCLPMIRFDHNIRDHKKGKECIRYIKYSLQQILDRLLNTGQKEIEIKNLPLHKPSSSRGAGYGGGAMSPPPPPPRFGGRGFPMPNPFPAMAGGAGGGGGFNPFPTTNPFSGPGVTLGGGAAAAAFGGSSTAAGSAASAFPPHHRASSFMGLSNPSFGPSFGMPPPPPPMSSFSRRRGRGTGLHSSSSNQTLRYTAPHSLSSGVPRNAITSPPSSCDMSDECAICMEELNERSCSALRVCNHVFHQDCLNEAFKSKPQCPVCRKSIGEPQGKCPSGIMTISTSPIHCSGFHVDSILIRYSISPSRQMSYHDNPGLHQGGKYETAYLPDNTDGQNLCKRLKYAFMHGLTFIVGTSLVAIPIDQTPWFHEW